MTELTDRARRIRERIMTQVRKHGSAPTVAELRQEFGVSNGELTSDLRDLEGAICIAVQDAEHAESPSFQDEQLTAPQPPLGELVYARPFATFKNHYPITVDGEQKWYAECAVEACAISTQFPGSDVVVHSICRQTKQPIQLVARDGVLLDYSPRTLRVHLRYPLREMPYRVVGWCDYNSFFASEDAFEQWRNQHREEAGITRSPDEMAHLITETLAVGRLNYGYQPRMPLLTIAREMRAMGLTRRTRLGFHIPDPFFLPTLTMVRDWKLRLGNFLHLRLR